MRKNAYWLTLVIGTFLIGCFPSNPNNEGDRVLFGLSEQVDRILSGGALVEELPPVGFQVSCPGSCLVSESFGVLEIPIVMVSQPSSNVTFTVSGDKPSDAELNTSSITFTPENWDQPQSVIVSGIDNFIIDGSRPMNLIFGSVSSDDPRYNGLTIETVVVTILDNESYDIIVTPLELTIYEGAFNGTGSDKGEFYVALSAAPTSNVVVPTITSEDETEGTISPTSLTFTPENWNKPQKVTVTSVDDGVEDGNQVFNINPGNSTSDETGYNLSLSKVKITNMDKQAPILLNPLVLDLVEAPNNDFGPNSGVVNVRLGSDPGCSSVTVNAVSSNTNRATVTPSSRSYSSANFNTNQTFTINTVMNGVEDAQEPVTISLSVNAGSCALTDKTIPSVTVNIEDNEGYGIRVSNMSRVTMEATPPTYTGEQDATYSVRLTKAPAEGTTVTIPINDTFDILNYQNREGLTTSNCGTPPCSRLLSLTFDSTNYNTPQIVRVAPVNDFEKDGDKQYIIEHKKAISSDPNYNQRMARNVTVTNRDRDELGITVTRYDGNITYLTGSNATIQNFATDNQGNFGSDYANFQIKLRSKPVENVTINLSSSLPSEGTPNPTTLVFSPSNWNVNQAVHVTGGRDNDTQTTNRNYNITTSITTSDAGYSGTVGRPTFNIYSCDNDGSNLIAYCGLSNSNLNHMNKTTEGGGTASFYLISQTQPGADVTVTMDENTITDGFSTRKEGLVTTPGTKVVTINSSNYNKLDSANSNRVVVTGQNDDYLDGNKTYTVFGTSLAPSYTLPNWSMTNDDNEQRFWTGGTGSTYEADYVAPGGERSATVWIYLGASPQNPVNFNIECTANCDEFSGMSLTDDFSSRASSLSNVTGFGTGVFGESNKLTIYVWGADDSIADGNTNFTIRFTGVSADTVFNSETATRNVSNVDNEPAAKRVYVTNTKFNGEFTAQGVIGADGFCQSDSAKPDGTYKAMLVTSSGATNRRIATTDGSTNAGQLNWVIQPNLHYYLWTGSGSDATSRLFIANSHGLIPFPMVRGFSSSGSDKFWTGMNTNQTSLVHAGTTNNCLDWTYTNNQGSSEDYFGRTGVGNATGTTAISNSTENCNMSTPATNGFKLICVEQ